MRYEVVSGKEYPVYSRDEADELGLSYKHPFDVLEGEYGVSSDNEVGICLKKSAMKSGAYKVKYPWGPSFIRSSGDNIKSAGRMNNYTASGKNDVRKHSTLNGTTWNDKGCCYQHGIWSFARYKKIFNKKNNENGGLQKDD